MDISSVLNEARSQDKTKRNKAEEILNQLAQKDLPTFLLSLALEIHNEEKIRENRQLAASVFKNFLIFNEKIREKWISINIEQTLEIKNLILSSIASKVKEVRKAAGLVIVGICKVDLPRSKWPDILNVLIETSINSDLNTRLSSLDTLGMICEEVNLNKGINQQDVDQILTVLVKNLSGENIDFLVGQYVLNTLLNITPLACKNFKNKSEAAVIFNFIFSCINIFKSHPNFDDLIHTTIQIFIEIMSLYYDYIEETTFFKMAQFSMEVFSTSSLEKVLILNFEFWLCITEYELEISDSKLNKGYTEKLLPQLLKQVNIFLKKSYVEDNEDDDDEDDEWNLSGASLYLLSLLVQFADNNITDNIMNYVKQSLGSSDWKQKKEGLLILGCLLESNFKEEMKSVIKSSIEGLLNLLFDSNFSVRKTCSWVLYKLTELYPMIFDKKLLDTFIPVLINALSDGNSVSNKICHAITHLNKELGDEDTVRNSNSMSPYFESLFKELLSLAYKESSYNRDINVSFSAFLAISIMIKSSSLDKQDKLEEILLFLMNSFENTLIYDHLKDKDKSLDFQCYIINVIGTIMEKSLKSFNNEIILKLYTLIESSFKLRNGVFDEAISSISAIAKNQNEGFQLIMDRFLPYLRYSLSRLEEPILLSFALIATGDIAKALKSKFAKYVNEILPDLFTVLQEKNISKKNKVLALDMFGDIILNVPEILHDCLKDLMSILFSACQIAVIIEENDDEDNYLENLRNSLVEVFTSVAFAMKDLKKEKEFAEYVPLIFEFLGTISKDEYDAPNKLLKSIIGFVADMCSTYGKDIKVLIQANPFIHYAINKLKSSKSKKNLEFLIWAEEVNITVKIGNNNSQFVII